MLQFELVNNPWEDPCIFATLKNKGEAWLIDCGNISKIAIHDLLKVNKVFITHTHIDHFIGFDQVLRMNLKSEKCITVYGPENITQQIASKLQGYSWNLTEKSKFVIKTCELLENKIVTSTFPCAEKFHLTETKTEEGNSPLLDYGIKLSFCPVSHAVPCIAYAFTEPNTSSVNQQALKKSNLTPGSWLSTLKSEFLNNHNTSDNKTLNINGENWEVSKLKELLLEEVQGKRLAYITDTIFNKITVASLTSLVKEPDEVWCEASYLNDNLSLARANMHMTARQAGRLAGELKAKKLFLFHYSRRYKDELMLHIKESQDVFTGTSIPSQYCSSR